MNFLVVQLNNAHEAAMILAEQLADEVHFKGTPMEGMRYNNVSQLLVLWGIYRIGWEPAHPFQKLEHGRIE